MTRLKEFTVSDPETGDELTISLPTKNQLCSRCDGNGKHVNPAIDGQGISPFEFDEDTDFEEGYFSGRYDVQCEECRGDRVIEVVDAEACERQGKAHLLKLYLQELDRQAEDEREARVTLYWETGGMMGSRS